jgi:hypothetical protein
MVTRLSSKSYYIGFSIRHYSTETNPSLNFNALDTKNYIVYAEKRPWRYWHDVGNQRKFFDELAIKLNIKEPSDWYKVIISDVVKNGGGALMYL